MPSDALLEHGTYVVFDVETTGFGREARIVEIAAVRLEGFEPVEEWQTLIHPGIPIPYMASRVHLIDDAMVAGAPAFSQVCSSFLHLLRDAVLVGHNIFTFDLHVLQRHLREACGASPGLMAIDTLPLARQFYRLESHKLGVLAEHLRIPLVAHQAMSDVYATAELWLRMCERLAQRGCKRVGDVEHFKAFRHVDGPMLPRYADAPNERLYPRSR
jgi:DNA polymerase-3 subunit epsilon